MQTEFVTYAQALELKKIGFDEPCFSFYSNDSDILYYDIDPDDHTLEWYDQSSIEIRNFSWVYRTSAPLKQHAFRWFREKHNFIGVVGLFSISNQGISSFEFHVDKIHYIGPSNFQEFVGFKTYEEAESACIDKLIEIIILNPALK